MRLEAENIMVVHNFWQQVELVLDSVSAEG
jgi:hypothetical protein